MKNKLSVLNQYKQDIFSKLDFQFKAGHNLLDVGCGDGSDAEIFRDVYKLQVTAVDVYEHERVKSIKDITYKKASILQLPFDDKSFQYVFLHDVLHHIDEDNQDPKKHREGLLEIARVTKPDGHIIIVEGNRYNPLFYPHMVKMLGHDHWRQSYFKKAIQEVFPGADFDYFEAHYYPPRFIRFWKLYEKFMEAISPEWFLAYNVAIIHNQIKQ